MPDYSKLARMIKGEIRRGAPMSEYTSFRVGGPVDCLAFPARLEDLQEILNWIRREKVPYFILGNGTNLLVRDGGIRGVAVSLARLPVERKADEGLMYAGAGEPLGRVVEFASREGWAGLEFAAGIPGSVGGALFMNAGAFQGEMKDVVASVRLLDAAGNVCTRDNAACRFSYRSMFMEDGEVILDGTFRLTRDDGRAIHLRMEEILAKRRARHPYDLPSAGSVFKNPPLKPAGKLIEEAGLKGMRLGGAQVSEKHANFIVNRGGARAREILDLMHFVEERILWEKGIKLEPEIRIVGED